MERDELEREVNAGKTVREIAADLGRSRKTITKWLRIHGLATQRSARRSQSAERLIQQCGVHGATEFLRRGAGGWRCLRCRSEAVARRRRKVKDALVAEAGGRCEICGYDRYAGALQFHHVDPASKRFSLSHTGVTRSLQKAREEAQKCVLVCGNCHAEVEAGITALPYSVRRRSGVAQLADAPDC